MKKDYNLIMDASPCDVNLYPDGPPNITEVKKLGRQLCPYFSKCNSGLLSGGHQCAILFGSQVAQNALKEGHSVDAEMTDFRREMTGQLPRMAPKGIIWSADRKTFEIITDTKKAMAMVSAFAKMVLGDNEPRGAGPPRRSFNELVAGAITPDGAVDLAKIDALEGSCGRNGGRGCDVTSGPCSCGAWH